MVPDLALAAAGLVLTPTQMTMKSLVRQRSWLLDKLYKYPQ